LLPLSPPLELIVASAACLYFQGFDPSPLPFSFSRSGESEKPPPRILLSFRSEYSSPLSQLLPLLVKPIDPLRQRIFLPPFPEQAMPRASFKIVKEDAIDPSLSNPFKN